MEENEDEPDRQTSLAPDHDSDDRDDRDHIISLCDKLCLSEEFLQDILSRDVGYRSHLGSENVIREKLKINYFKSIYDTSNQSRFFYQIGFSKAGGDKIQTFIQEQTEGRSTHLT